MMTKRSFLSLVACVWYTIAACSDAPIVSEPTAAPSSSETSVVVPQSQGKQVRVYVDMIGDLFHAGHIAFIQQARQFGTYLIVGLCNDEVSTAYKRRPILTMEERAVEVAACRYVDEVLLDAPLVLTDEWLDQHKIDIVVHGDDYSAEKFEKYYGAAKRRGILRSVPYTKGISTSDLIRRIRSRSEQEINPK